MTAPKPVAVIGAGLMGSGIAAVFARAGHQVRVFDPSEDARSSLGHRARAALEVMGVSDDEATDAVARLSAHDTINAAVAGASFVTEAGPERVEAKQAIFSEVEAAAPDDCIFASNTSVIPITGIMSGLRNRARALGTHWWNPPHMIPLVEVTRTEWTSPEAMDTTVALLGGLGKKPVRVEKDIAGFIGNRLQHALWREAISLVENGVCSAEAVDDVVKSSFGRRLAVLGPIENADLVGTDLTLDIHNVILSELEASGAPSPYLKELVTAGRLGMKTGEGFRAWSPEEAEAVRKRVGDHLKKLETILN